MTKKTAGATRKPNSVSVPGYPKTDDDHSSRMQIALHLMRPTRELGRAALRHSPIWSCTGWGLQSFPGHPENWCALTAPFHPYPAKKAGRYTFCCTFLRVAATPRYGAPCPAVFGLSSGSESDPAVVWIAPAALNYRHTYYTPCSSGHGGFLSPVNYSLTVGTEF